MAKAKATCALKIGIGRALNRVNMFAALVGSSVRPSASPHIFYFHLPLSLLREQSASEGAEGKDEQGKQDLWDGREDLWRRREAVHRMQYCHRPQQGRGRRNG